MKLGVLTVPLYGMSLEDALKYLHGLGVQAVELGGGCYPGNTHTLPYITGEKPVSELKALLEKYDLTLSAVAAQGNYIHPNKEQAAQFQKGLEDSILLAEKMGCDTVNVFSGCPGDCPESKNPNWVTCPWPPEYLEVLDWQWNEVLIPYWKKQVAFAREHGVTKLAFEMHPGFLVYNTETLLKLRHAVGPEIGANLDPSHLVWQGMNIVDAITMLGNEGAIFHFHAKDTRIDEINTRHIGVLDTKHYGGNDRAWDFRSVGYGHDNFFWKEVVSALQRVGYDGTLSIEHEDSRMSVKEGLEKAIAVLKDVLVFEKPGEMWWA